MRTSSWLIHIHTHGHTDPQTQAMTIPEGQNWPRVKMTVGDEMFLIWQMFIKKKCPAEKKCVGDMSKYGPKLHTSKSHQYMLVLFWKRLKIQCWLSKHDASSRNTCIFTMANHYRQVDLEFQGSFPLVATMGTTCKSSTLMPSRDRSINYQAISSYLMMTELNVLLKKLGHFQFI